MFQDQLFFSSNIFAMAAPALPNHANIKNCCVTDQWLGLLVGYHISTNGRHDKNVDW